MEIILVLPPKCKKKTISHYNRYRFFNEQSSHKAKPQKINFIKDMGLGQLVEFF